MNKYYNAFISSKPLWTGEIDGLQQFQWDPPITVPDFQLKLLKFGHQVEQLLNEALLHDDRIEVLATNLQINGLERTLGEIDALIRFNEHVYHIENAFKFYLLDDRSISYDLNNLIGPNRTDSFQHKIDHIREHQFPLLKHPETSHKLEQMGLIPKDIKQRVLFKGMIFLPQKGAVELLPLLNAEAVSGTYLRMEELESFEDNKFHILPNKIDWILSPTVSNEWRTLGSVVPFLSSELSQEKSVFVWRKDTKGNLFRHFIVWW